MIVFSISIAIVVLGFCFLRPSIGLIMLLNMNLIRNLININFIDPCLKCTRDSDLFLGALIPLLGFILIFFRLDLSKRIKYTLDYVDLFFIANIVVLLYSSFFSLDVLLSLDFLLRYIFLGISFYFISKLYFMNVQNFEKELNSMITFSIYFGLFFGCLAVLIVFVSGYEEPYAAYGVVMRLTLPGVHPIPFAQAIGLGVLASAYRITHQIRNKKIDLFLFISGLILLLILLFSNTRGVLISLILSLFLFFFFILPKIQLTLKAKRILIGVSFIFVLGIILFVDFDAIFGRFYSKYSAQSTSLRIDAYLDSLSIFTNHLFTGIGGGTFNLYSVLPYPHNIVLEYLAHYGLLGLILISWLFILLYWMLMVSLKKAKNDYIYAFIFSLVIFYFIETQFSFTLWMHKGFYYSLGLFIAYHFRRKND